VIIHYYVDRMNPLFPCNHGVATHSCIMHDLVCGTLCKNAYGHAVLISQCGKSYWRRFEFDNCGIMKWLSRKTEFQNFSDCSWPRKT